MAEGGIPQGLDINAMQRPFKQVYDFYVFRDVYRENKNNDIIRNSVNVKPTSSGPSRIPVPFYGNEGDLEYNASNVRIPALLCLSQSITIQDYFASAQHHRQQIGCHVLVRKNKLHSCVTDLDKFVRSETSRYRMVSFTDIHCIYPILQNERNGGKLCLGLHFKRPTTGGNREFISRQLDNCDHRGIEEITEDYFDAFYNNPKGPMSVYGLLSPKSPHTEPSSKFHIIYVCAGARLTVYDSCSIDPRNGKPVATVSLFQQGSFLILESRLSIGLKVGYRKPDGKFRMCYSEALEALKNDRNPNILPEDLKTKLRTFSTRCTLFLGSTDSECNSVGWQLVISNDAFDLTMYNGTLYAPEGGRFIDVKSFNKGFWEVYYRHRYEQLYNAVLSSVTPKYGYLVPDVSTCNEILGTGPHLRQYYLRTSIYVNSDLVSYTTGMGGLGFPMAYYFPYEERHPILMVEKERVVERNSVARPLVVPLNPCIIGEDQIPQHISPLVAIEREPDSEIYLIENMRYVLHFGQMPEHEWEYTMDLADLEDMVAQHGEEVWDGLTMKCGFDYRIYQKVGTRVIGLVEGFYFARVPDHPNPIVPSF